MKTGWWIYSESWLWLVLWHSSANQREVGGFSMAWELLLSLGPTHPVCLAFFFFFLPSNFSFSLSSANPHTRKRFSVEITGMSARQNDVTTSGPTFPSSVWSNQRGNSIPAKRITHHQVFALCLYCTYFNMVWSSFPLVGAKKTKKKLVRNFWNKKKTQTQSCRKQTRVVNHDADSRWWNLSAVDLSDSAWWLNDFCCLDFSTHTHALKMSLPQWQERVTSLADEKLGWMWFGH